MFKSRNYSSNETYDIAKFLNFDVDVYDVINAPLLEELKKLPVNKYYKVKEGYKEIDMISTAEYGNPFFSYYIQFYNDIFEETLSEDTELKLFSFSDFIEVCDTLNIGEY